MSSSTAAPDRNKKRKMDEDETKIPYATVIESSSDTAAAGASKRKRSARSQLLDDKQSTATLKTRVNKLMDNAKDFKEKAEQFYLRGIQENREDFGMLDDSQDIVLGCLPGFDVYKKRKDDAIDNIDPTQLVYCDNDKWFHIKESCMCLSKHAKRSLLLAEAKKKKMKATWCCSLI